ncbi:MAG: UvrB/UvrC motif-containing protein [Planctomycetes bacterium]|nr:UvrB/UvrC motif-containing protein [Planctomycetota bacterium]
MQYCTACQKAIATIVIMDVSDGSVTGSQHLCAACAEQMGVVQPKSPKFSAEMLEDLLGGFDKAKSSAGKRQRAESCPGCGMTPAEFRTKGRLGCPRCYEVFRDELLPLLQRIHEAQTHRGRLPACRPATEPAEARARTARDDEALAELRRRLEEAVRNERYEEAAQLRDALRRAERGEEAAS